jgi:ubiquinone/menaquinone biosynthesis C-methylase UbiE
MHSGVSLFQMKRAAIDEVFDTDSSTPAEVATTLFDLRNINRWFGGNTTTAAMTDQVTRGLPPGSVSLLEVAAGSGDALRTASGRLERRGLQLQVTLLDRAWSHLSNGHPGRDHQPNGRRIVVGDALVSPFRDGSFDLVGCCLFAHHLSPEQLVRFVNESLRVCRRAVLINDLVRHPLHVGLVYVSLPLYRSRITRHDAPASVRGAYTIKEMRALLRQTTAARVEIHQHYLFRMGAIAWKS